MESDIIMKLLYNEFKKCEYKIFDDLERQVYKIELIITNPKINIRKMFIWIL